MNETKVQTTIPQPTCVSCADFERFEEINRILPSMIRAAGEAFIGGDMHGAVDLGRRIHKLRAEHNKLEASQLAAASAMFDLQTKGF